MTAHAAAAVQHLPPRPAESLDEWASTINRLAARAGGARKGSDSAGRRGAGQNGMKGGGGLLLTGGDFFPGAGQPQALSGEAYGCRMAPEVAETLVAD